MEKIEALSERLVKAMSGTNPANPTLNGPNQELFSDAITSYWQEMLNNPAKVFEHQASYWGKSVKHYVEAQQALSKGKLEAPKDEFTNDRRFKNALWETNPYFNFVKQQYLINAEAITTAVESVEGMDEVEKTRLKYFSQQIIDMMAPTNFLGTNPDALERAVETDGQSLLDGLENLVSDLEANNGELIVKLADEKAFELGVNIATTPGRVIYRNKMMEL
ncbi:MAG: hypothetical protein ABJM57_14620, partial [Lentilitoribacter sp.]